MEALKAQVAAPRMPLPFGIKVQQGDSRSRISRASGVSPEAQRERWGGIRISRSAGDFTIETTREGLTYGGFQFLQPSLY